MIRGRLPFFHSASGASPLVLSNLVRFPGVIKVFGALELFFVVGVCTRLQFRLCEYFVGPLG